MKPARATVARSRVALAAALAVAALGAALLWMALDGSPPREHRFALSPQECNTECQLRQTDCIDDCEGNVACERKCTETGLRCVARCRTLGRSDAGVAGSGGSGGTAGRGGAAGAPNGGGAGGRAGAGGAG